MATNSIKNQRTKLPNTANAQTAFGHIGIRVAEIWGEESSLQYKVKWSNTPEAEAKRDLHYQNTETNFRIKDKEGKRNGEVIAMDFIALPEKMSKLEACLYAQEHNLFADLGEAGELALMQAIAGQVREKTVKARKVKKAVLETETVIAEQTPAPVRGASGRFVKGNPYAFKRGNEHSFKKGQNRR
jgi:hypothetical protein